MGLHKFPAQRGMGNEITVQLCLIHIGRAAVIRGHKEDRKILGETALHLRHGQSREHMGADDGIDVPLRHIAIDPMGIPGIDAVAQGFAMLPGRALRQSVAQGKQLRGVESPFHMDVCHCPGFPGGVKGQSVQHRAPDAPLSRSLQDGAARRVVAAAVVAGQHKNFQWFHCGNASSMVFFNCSRCAIRS